MKKLRELYPVDLVGRPKRIRFFCVGEYGDREMRPHLHVLLFNHDFADKYFWKKSESGEDMFRSDELERVWTYGLSTVQALTWESAAYVARYAIKKTNGEKAAERYLREVDVETGECTYLEPEYVCMSRRPGIGREWYDRFKSDCRKGFLTAELGQKFAVPAYYDRILEEQDAAAFEEMKRRRKEAASERSVTRKRLAGMEHYKDCQVKRLKRSV
jgi:hypothetical protein